VAGLERAERLRRMNASAQYFCGSALHEIGEKTADLRREKRVKPIGSMNWHMRAQTKESDKQAQGKGGTTKRELGPFWGGWSSRTAQEKCVLPWRRVVIWWKALRPL